MAQRSASAYLKVGKANRLFADGSLDLAIFHFGQSADAELRQIRRLPTASHADQMLAQRCFDPSAINGKLARNWALIIV